MMKEIDFEKIVLLNEFSAGFKYLECIEEHNSKNSLKFKSLIFKENLTKYNFEIKIFMELNGNCIDIETLFENVCKNIEVEDSIMDLIIFEIGKCAEILEDEFKIYNKEIRVDSMFIKKKSNRVIDFNNLKKEFVEVYERLKPNKMEYYNYVNDLLVFGENGLQIALILKELGIANFRRSRSGYMINFLDEIDNYSNMFTYSFSRELFKYNIPSIAVPIEMLEQLW